MKQGVSFVTQTLKKMKKIDKKLGIIFCLYWQHIIKALNYRFKGA